MALILNVMGRQKECEQFDQKARELYVTLEQSVSLKKRWKDVKTTEEVSRLQFCIMKKELQHIYMPKRERLGNRY